MQSWIFSIITPVSHDPSETFLLISMLKTVVLPKGLVLFQIKNFLKIDSPRVIQDVHVILSSVENK